MKSSAIEDKKTGKRETSGRKVARIEKWMGEKMEDGRNSNIKMGR
jgi:hypothetical protein